MSYGIRVDKNELLYLGFNQTQTLFINGTETGFNVYNNEPFCKIISRNFNNCGLAIVEMLNQSNLFALVGGGKNPRFPNNKVIIWDDNTQTITNEITFKSEIKNVRLSREIIVVATDNKIYVLRLNDFQQIYHIETGYNKYGLCVLTDFNDINIKTLNSLREQTSEDHVFKIIACPDMIIGDIRIVIFIVYKSKPPVIFKDYTIKAHTTELSCLTFNKDGTKLASSSINGTLIRIFNITDYEKCLPIQELRRGTEAARIYSIVFSENSDWLAVTSDKGTVHIFVIDNRVKKINNPKSSLYFLRDILPKYFSSEWSFAQFRLPEGKHIVAFGKNPENSLIVVGEEGFMYKTEFDTKSPNQCIHEFYANFVKIN
jgi:WD40 repeat protein